MTFKYFPLTVLMIASISGCSSLGGGKTSSEDSYFSDSGYTINDPASGVDSLKQLQNLNEKNLVKISGDDAQGIRLKAMREAALIIGAQRGYNEYVKGVRIEIEKREHEMDQMFDFRALMLLASDGVEDKYLLPPVLQEAKDALAVEEGGQLLKVSDTVYRIVQKEQLVSAPLTWREYLFPSETAKENFPHKSLLPRDSSEREMWAKWVHDGWVAGMEQGETEMLARIRKMGRDFTGMVRYMILLERKVIQPPVIAVANDKVVGGGDQMAVRQTTYRITMPSSLDASSDRWKMIEIGERESLRQTQELESEVAKSRQPGWGKW